MIDLEQLARILDNAEFSDSYIGYKPNHEAVYLLFNGNMDDADKAILESMKRHIPDSNYSITERSTESADHKQIDTSSFGIIENPKKGKLSSLEHFDKYYWIECRIK